MLKTHFKVALRLSRLLAVGRKTTFSSVLLITTIALAEINLAPAIVSLSCGGGVLRKLMHFFLPEIGFDEFYRIVCTAV